MAKATPDEDSPIHDAATQALDFINHVTEYLLERWTHGKARAPKVRAELVRKAHRNIHKVIYAGALARFMEVRRTVGKPVTREQAYQRLHEALVETETNQGKRQWIEKWYPRYYVPLDDEDSEA